MWKESSENSSNNNLKYIHKILLIMIKLRYDHHTLISINTWTYVTLGIPRQQSTPHWELSIMHKALQVENKQFISLIQRNARKLL